MARWLRAVELAPSWVGFGSVVGTMSGATYIRLLRVRVVQKSRHAATPRRENCVLLFKEHCRMYWYAVFIFMVNEYIIRPHIYDFSLPRITWFDALLSHKLNCPLVYRKISANQSYYYETSRLWHSLWITDNDL